MKPSVASAGQVTSQPTTPVFRPKCGRIFQKAGARRIVLVTGRTGGRFEAGAPPGPSTPPASGSAAPTTKPWMRWRPGPTPVALAGQSEGAAEAALERRTAVPP